MRTYKIGSYIIESSFELDAPAHPPATIISGKFQFRRKIPIVYPLKQVYRSNSKTWIAKGYGNKNETLIVFRYGIRVQIKRKRESCQIILGGADKITCQVFARKYLIPLFLQNIGEVVFHGSSVGIGQRAIVFLGSSGAGKSTLAFLLSLRNFKFIADDFVWLTKQEDAVRIIPLARDSYLLKRNQALKMIPNIQKTKLFPAGGKTGIRLLDEIPSPQPKVTDLVFLDSRRAKSLSYRMLSGSEKVRMAFENLYGLSFTNYRHLPKIFTHTLDLVEDVRFWKLTYPHNYHNLDKTFLCLNELIQA